MNTTNQELKLFGRSNAKHSNNVSDNNAFLFHYKDFNDLGKLSQIKKTKKLSVSVVIPTLNEEQTIYNLVCFIKSNLMDNYKLVDEIIIIDSGSSDSTIEKAIAAGAKVSNASDIQLENDFVKGKGENLWRSLYSSTGDIIVWVDADIINFHEGFITGLIGPLLENDNLYYTTTYYKRPLQIQNQEITFNGGRVGEILVRPLLSYFFPELCNFFQPTSGEHAGKRSLLERLPFFSGYAVDVGHLLDITYNIGQQIIGQVNLETRLHRHQEINFLHRQSFGILQALMQRAEELGRITINSKSFKLHSVINEIKGNPKIVSDYIKEIERPPIIRYDLYKNKFNHAKAV